MIIAPAILVSSFEEFDRQLKTYSEFAEYIDIDINVSMDDFKGIVTVDLEDVLTRISDFDGSCKFNYHLMVTDPTDMISTLLNHDHTPHKIYIHQEIDFNGIPISDSIGLTVRSESELLDIETYSKYTEVQLMTIKTGAQGNPIKPEILERSRTLRSMGFEGMISIDGGVNEETASLVKQYPIDKVSVGSYFSKSVNPKQNFEKLTNLLQS